MVATSQRLMKPPPPWSSGWARRWWARSGPRLLSGDSIDCQPSGQVTAVGPRPPGGQQGASAVGVPAAMADVPASVKGMNDLLPPDVSKWHYLEEKARGVLESFAYRE